MSLVNNVTARNVAVSKYSLIRKILGLLYVDITKSESLIRNYATQTYLLNGHLHKLKDKGLSDLAIKQLKEFEKNLKVPLAQALIDYYEAKYNPEIDFEEIYLKSLGFNLCGECGNRRLIENLPPLKELLSQSILQMFQRKK